MQVGRAIHGKPGFSNRKFIPQASSARPQSWLTQLQPLHFHPSALNCHCNSEVTAKQYLSFTDVNTEFKSYKNHMMIRIRNRYASKKATVTRFYWQDRKDWGETRNDVTKDSTLTFYLAKIALWKSLNGITADKKKLRILCSFSFWTITSNCITLSILSNK